MFNGHKAAGPFADLQRGGQGGNANPNGNGWGRMFQNQYGAPPGQMRDQWQQFKQTNGFGGGQPDMGQGQPQMPPQAPQAPQMGIGGPFNGMGQGMDRMQMLRQWLAQRNRGLLGQ